MVNVGMNKKYAVSHEPVHAGAEFVPFCVGAEGGPAFFPGFGVFKGEHVSEIWEAVADEGLAEEDRDQSDPPEDGEFPAVEHFDFFPAGLEAVAFVSAQLEDA